MRKLDGPWMKAHLSQIISPPAKKKIRYVSNGLYYWENNIIPIRLTKFFSQIYKISTYNTI